MRIERRVNNFRLMVISLEEPFWVVISNDRESSRIERIETRARGRCRDVDKNDAHGLFFYLDHARLDSVRFRKFMNGCLTESRQAMQCWRMRICNGT